MRNIFYAIAVLVFLSSAAGCSKYDDSGLWDTIDGLNGRIEDIESEAESANSDIESLMKVIDALRNDVYIERVKADGNGYVVYFSDGSSASLSSGESGMAAPVLSIAKDVDDGVYYWTLDGSWMIMDGKRIPAQGVDGEKGQEGTSPKLRINPETMMWEVSADGDSWVSTGVVAEGKDGSAGPSGSCIFREVRTSDPSYVTFVLADGTEIDVPRAILFDVEGMSESESNDFLCGSNSVYDVEMAAVSGSYIVSPDGWSAVLDMADSTLSITAPAKENEFAEMEGDVAVYLSSAAGIARIVKFWVKALPYEIRVLTFEDGDYKGSGNFLGNMDWSSLIDSPQYGGNLLYGENASQYFWYDEGNTELMSSGLPGDFGFSSGGHAVSDYVGGTAYDYTEQLALLRNDAAGIIPGQGGHGGSKNFCVHYGYADDSGSSYGVTLPSIFFGDGKARTIDHMWVNGTAYLAHSAMYGDGFNPPMAPGEWIRIVAIGYDENGEESGRLEYSLAEIAESGDARDGIMNMDSWNKWDLSGLGDVLMVEFNMEGNSRNEYGFSMPAYFAYDDVAVIFE